MVTPEMLGHLYENALRVQRRQGKDLELNGVHYTPLSLTRNVLARIPLEELPPSKRYALDIACGSGTFLLAASTLRTAFDANEADAGSSVVHHLREHVIGNDRDGIALHVANLTYLLEHVIETGNADAVPSPRLWGKDALGLVLEDFGDNRPSIIVGNPPFGRSTDGHQLANKFLLKAIELLAPGGFLGMVMPGAFLKMMQRGGTTATRKQLLQECELLESWEMPLGAVGLSARQETCVLIARKKKNEPKEVNDHKAVLFKVTYSSNKEAIQAQRDYLRSTWTFLASGLPGRPSSSWSEDETLNHREPPRSRMAKGRMGSSSVRTLRPCGGDHDEPHEDVLFLVAAQRVCSYLRQQQRLLPYFLLERDWRDNRDPVRGFDVRLMSSLSDASGVPTEGKKLIIVAAVNNVLHFRSFDGNGKLVVDTDQNRLTEQTQQIEDLRKQLESFWPPHKLTKSDKGRVITAVTSVIGQTPVRNYVDPSTAERSGKTKQALFLGPKLIVTSNTNRNSEVQVKAAFDDAGVFPEHNLSCLGLFDASDSLSPWVRQLFSEVERRDLLLWIAAVMNSPVAQAWVAVCSPPRSSALDVFMSLPLPAFDPVLARLVEQTSSLPRSSDQFSELVDEINGGVFRSYGLTGTNVDDIQRFLRSLTDPWAESLSLAHLPKARPYRRISGTVVSIDVQGQRVALDLPRYSRESAARSFFFTARAARLGAARGRRVYVRGSDRLSGCQRVAQRSMDPSRLPSRAIFVFGRR